MEQYVSGYEVGGALRITRIGDTLFDETPTDVWRYFAEAEDYETNFWLRFFHELSS